ncbi:MAG: homocysteine S-methyltransferase family protein [Lachnospiraceae bacterium]|jgi:5-methyltetrahydrofolate--homocysteine methyltransferase|nr:homocysteine S-methyltransferase family protein [Lachnospiraceae bacterium]
MGDLREILGKKLVFLDGGMGTLIQKAGLKAGELPESWNITHPETMREIHGSYVEAGSDIIVTNTFGANRLKFYSDKYSLSEIVSAAVKNARQGALAGLNMRKNAVRSKVSDSTYDTAYVMLDIGPTGKLLKPMGELDFEEAVSVFKEVIEIGVATGVDGIYIETMSDTYELKAAVLAAKEVCDLPVFATVVLDENGRLLTGADIRTVIALLEGLRVDALGINCGLGPKTMLPFVKEVISASSIPVIMKPNAGLPVSREGETYYDIGAEEFAGYIKEAIESGAALVGGCCGTMPCHIKAVYDLCHQLKVLPIVEKGETIVSSGSVSKAINERPVIIGERLNPTGKKALKEAIKLKDYAYLVKEGLAQIEAGAQILDVNVGVPEINEKEVLPEAIVKLQNSISAPLQIDSVDIDACEKAMRLYNGKPMLNSVNGKIESMNSVFPLIKKYGGVVVGLCLDEAGIGESAEGRYAIAQKIIKEAEKYGIKKKDIVIDALTLTISSDKNAAKITLAALKRIKEELGVCTVLGVSNVSFGLPARDLINSNFYAMALNNGLSAGIINPLSGRMMQTYYSYLALNGYDDNFNDYIDKYSDFRENAVYATESSRRSGEDKPDESPDMKKTSLDVSNNNNPELSATWLEELRIAVIKGLKEDSMKITSRLLEKKSSMDIIEKALMPALDEVGLKFEAKTFFLPQLLMSAQAAKAAFELIREKMNTDMVDLNNEKAAGNNKIILATVKGDIHDIGKNIVKVLLENYGYDIIDLGKNVEPSQILEIAKEKDVTLLGLSALMTTTVGSMEATIKLLQEEKPDCKVMVGGAVLTQEYADQIGADFYGKDAMSAVRYAKEYFKS